MNDTNYEALLRDRQSHGLDPIKVAADWLKIKDRQLDKYIEQFERMLPRKANGR